MQQQIICLIGKPVAHSISSVFQQAALDYCGIRARYQSWEVEKADLSSVVERLRLPDHLGANVTIPYKEMVVPMLDDLEDFAAKVGAVNTIVARHGRLSGHNTDGQGFLRALEQEAEYRVAGAHALVLGAGGAARAVVMALLSAGAGSVTVANRTVGRAERLVGDMQQYASQTVLKAASLAGPEIWEQAVASELIVNCTSLGMSGTGEQDSVPLPAMAINPHSVVFDIVANPVETRFLEEARERGAWTINGLAMLVHQGAAAFELWVERPAPLEEMMEAARRAMSISAAR